jgi:tetratricopeptide (TPR) repeat protein
MAGEARPGLRARAFALAPLLLILLATTLVYMPGMGGGFIFDDFQNLLANRSIAMGDAEHQSWVAAMFSSPASDLQRPLAMLTFAINHYFGGFDSRQMKATNLGIHLLNVLLVFALVRGLARDALAGDEERARRIALFASACWALHPINLMAVLYVVQRMESLCHTFVFAGLLMYAAGRRRQLAGRMGWGHILGGLGGGTLLGLACKESAVLLPLYALLVEATIFRWRGAGGPRQRGLPLLYTVVLFVPGVLGVLWLLPRALNPASWASRNFDLGQRLLTEGRVLLDYLHWSVLPDLRSLSLYHDDYVVSRGLLQPPSTLLAFALLAALAALAWALRRRRPLFALGIAWFFAAQALTATIVPLELVFEHRNYFASVGICLALADLCMLPADAGPRRALGIALASCFVLFLAGTTWLRADEWSSPLRFAETEASKHPHSARATYELARLLIIAGNYDPASPFTARAWPALDKAMQAPGSDALPYQAALMLAARTGQPLRQEWWQGLQRSLRDNPLKPQNQLALIALDNCSLEEICELPPADMLATFNAALEKGDQAGILSIYGKYALQQLGDHELGLRLWREAARLDPGNAQFRINLAMLYSDLDRPEEARRELAALRLLGRFDQYRADADALERRLPPVSTVAPR